MINRLQKDSKLWYVLLHVAILFLSLSGILSKFASKEKFMSTKFIVLYGSMIIVLGIYALVWQQLLKHIQLSTAFCNKAVSIVWGIIWGCTIFEEKIKWNMIVGAVIVMVGVIIVVKSDEH